MRSGGNPTEGTIATGVVYSGNVFDVGIEALLPLTRAAGTGAGFAALFRLRLERWLGGTLFR